MREMKDSGVEWLEKIPTDWNIIRMTKCFKFFKGLDIKKTDLVQYGSAVISYGQVHDKLNNGYSLQKNLIRYINQSMLEIKEKSRLSNGDFIFADTSEDLDGVGNCIYIDSDGELYAGYHTLVARCIEPDVCHKYLAFLFLTDAWRSQLRRNANGTKVYSVTQRMFKFVSCLLPPIDVQLKIVAYLEQKCDDVDTIIAKEQSVIEKLQEYKKAIITQAITRGLNSSAKMKKTGFEWIGMIPKHWNAKKIKYLTSKIGSGKTPKGGSDIYVDEGVLFIRSQNVYDGYFDLSSAVFISHDIDCTMSNTRVYRDDVLLNITGGSIGRSCLYESDELANVNQHVCIIRCNSEMRPKFMQYFWNSSIGKTSIDIYQSGANREGLNFFEIGNTVVPTPELYEQDKIISYLDDKCDSIDRVISQKLTIIDTLAEYKRSLIYEVVTGKKEVPHV